MKGLISFSSPIVEGTVGSGGTSPLFFLSNKIKISVVLRLRFGK
jgi:hypothetical protein